MDDNLSRLPACDDAFTRTNVETAARLVGHYAIRRHHIAFSYSFRYKQLPADSETAAP